MIDKRQLKDLVTRTLKEYDFYSKDALYLMLGTIAQESQSGTFLRQKTKYFDLEMHAVGITQVEQLTFNYVLEKYGTKYHLNWVKFEMLEWNLKLAIIFGRLKYLTIKAKLPSYKDINAMAKYWKKYYNSIDGIGKVEEFIDNYKTYVLG